MKKKLPVSLFIAVYFISLAAGFSFAGIRHAKATANAAPALQQAAWVIVRVDDMTREQPVLTSVWAMFTTYSPGPHVFFKPLYVADSRQSNTSALPRLFAVAPDRSIAKNFVKELDQMIPHRTGLVIVDHAGYQSFLSWFSSEPNDGKNEAVSYQTVCAVLSQPSQQAASTLPWASLQPNHLIVHPGLQKYTNLWDSFTSSTLQVHCEVITAP